MIFLVIPPSRSFFAAPTSPYQVGASSRGFSATLISQGHGVRSHTVMAPKPAAATTDSPPLPPPATTTTTTSTSASSKEDPEAPIPSKQPSRNPSPSSNLGAPPKNLDADDAMTYGKGASTSASTSQPMTKSSSSSSASNTAEAKDAAGTGPSPYGTRSRNKNGRARPNYAENEVDMTDYETFPDKKDNGDPKKPTQPASATSGPIENDAPPPRAAASSTRKPLPTTDSGKPAPSSIKEQQQPNLPGAAASSSSAANSSGAAQQPSKKRKAGTQTASAHSKDAQSNVPVPKPSLTSSLLRKSLGGATGYAETNLMSFDNCKSRPKNNALIADDGTVLAVNGKQTHLLLAVFSALREPHPLLMHPSRLCLHGLRTTW